MRPTPERAADVAAVPYDVVTVEEARTLAKGNPLSFLHVSRAEIDLDSSIDPYAPAVYEKAARNLQGLKAQAPLVTEDRPSLYVYHLKRGEHEQSGIAGCFSLTEYDQEIIKKHERTRRDKEDDRTRHMLALSAQTGPVFLTFRTRPVLDRLIAEITRTPALFDFVASDGVAHQLWQVPAADTPVIIREFAAIPALYVADGHHRAASAARARTELRQRHGLSGGTGGELECDSMLGVAFSHNQVQILPYNRIVRDLAGLNPEELLSALAARHRVEPGPAVPPRKGQGSLFLGDRWYLVTLGAGERSAPVGDEAASVIRELDVTVLQETVLEPILKIGDVRTDKRIDFVGGNRGPKELEDLVRLGKAAVAFSLHPVTVEDLMRVSDSGGIMPPKSTWFEPKLRDGLLSHLI